MCILATSKFLFEGATRVAQRCVRAFFMPLYAPIYSGAQPRELVVMADSAPSMKLRQRDVGTVFFCLQVLNH